MKLVKIIKASKPTFWYANEVGKYWEVYTVPDGGNYQIIRDGGYGPKYIDIEDCVELTKEDFEVLKEVFG